MIFWAFMFLITLLLPLTMLYFGRRFVRRPPPKINQSYGYRTGRSMKSQEAWLFAHRRFGWSWSVLGFLLLPVTAAPMLAVAGDGVPETGRAAAVLVVIQLAVMILSMVLTERTLKKRFDENGRPIPRKKLFHFDKERFKRAFHKNRYHM